MLAKRERCQLTPYKTKVMKIERRYFDNTVRASQDDSYDFAGLASRVSAPYVMYESDDEVWTEEIDARAFDDVLEDDVRVLIDHRPEMILGRTKAGTARVFLDETGLRYAWKNPDTSHGKNIAISITRGDVDQSSFGFSTKWEDSEWQEFTREDGRRETRRIIRKIRKLYDVSPVTFPANPDTQVQKNSFFEAINEYKNMAWLKEEKAQEEKQSQNNNQIEILEKLASLNSRVASW